MSGCLGIIIENGCNTLKVNPINYYKCPKTDNLFDYVVQQRTPGQKGGSDAAQATRTQLENPDPTDGCNGESLNSKDQAEATQKFSLLI